MSCLGIDLEPIARFGLATKPGGRAFLDRVYTPPERASVGGNPLLLGLYFTAKEAVAKALGTGFGLDPAAAVSCHDIEIRWAPGQERPTVALRRRAAARAADSRVSEVVVCWGHTASLAYAVAVDAGCSALLASLVAAFREELSTITMSRQSKCLSEGTLADIARCVAAQSEVGAAS